MCPCIKFKSNWRTLEFGTKFVQKIIWLTKILKKIIIKIVISIQQCTSVRNFSYFVELQIMVPNFPRKI